MFQGHWRGCLFIMPDLDIRRPQILRAVGNTEVCGEGRLVDDCGDGTDAQSTNRHRPLTRPDRVHHILFPLSTSHSIWPRRAHGEY